MADLGRTQVTKLIPAPRAAVYRACVDPDALAAWRVPDNMTAEVHAFEPREGGAFRMSLTYKDPALRGKTAGGTDTFQGRFVELVPDRKVVEAIEFASDDPSFAGEMRMTTSLSDAANGTEVTVLAEDIPSGIRPEDNEEGTRQALEKLSAFVTGRRDV